MTNVDRVLVAIALAMLVAAVILVAGFVIQPDPGFAVVRFR